MNEPQKIKILKCRLITKDGILSNFQGLDVVNGGGVLHQKGFKKG